MIIALQYRPRRARARALPVRRLYARDAIPVVERKERIMARRIPAREVLRLRSSNLSLNAIAAVLHASKASVSVVLRAAAEHDVAREETERMSAGEVYARLFPEREQEGPVYPVTGTTACSCSTSDCWTSQTTCSGRCCSSSWSCATVRPRPSSARSTGRRTGTPGWEARPTPRRSWTGLPRHRLAGDGGVKMRDIYG